MLAALAFIATMAHGCPQFFAGAAPPVTPAAVEICFDGYALGHSATAREPLWSAEHLTPAGASAALAAKRFGGFHVEKLLAPAARSKPSDFRCSRFDKGHMTPVGDFGDKAEEQDTFTMANMVPQDMALNEGLWAGIESAVLHAAAAGEEFYIVTGPAFGINPGKLNGRVTIPSSTWKAVYSVRNGWAGAYLAPNDASGHWRAASVTELASLIGFDPMPGLSASVKAVAGPLPAPTKGTTTLPDRKCAAR